MSLSPDHHSELETGNLICQSSRLTKPYRINILGPEHLGDIIDVQQQVLGSLEKPSSYYPGAHQIFEESLSGRGLIVGCYVEDSLIGFRSIWYPQNHSANLGIDLGLNSAKNLEEVAQLERTCVLPDFRGNRLQITMMQYMIDHAKRNKIFRYLLATVAPTNYASMQDKFVHNMVIFDLKKKYAGHYRYIFFQDLFEPIDAATDSVSPIIFIDAEDIESQCKILHNNGAYVGYMQKKNEENVMQVGYAQVNRSLF
jgi:ribosomal protein S18 acetylase RimI-like enzyme